MKDRTKDWIDKAESDFVAISRLKEKPEGIYDIICFHAQQCVEKYLKAILQEICKQIRQINKKILWAGGGR